MSFFTKLRRTSSLGIWAALPLALRRIYQRESRERPRADEALRASEAIFRGLFENVPDGVYQTSVDGRIIAANPALARMLGFETPSGMSLVDIAPDLYVNPGDRSLMVDKLEREGVLHNAELVLRRRDGQHITVLENARAVRNPTGDVLYYEGTITDITERKRHEQELASYTRQVEEARRKLEEQAGQLLEQSFELAEARNAALKASRLKSEVLANVSHEILTPLNGVLGMTELLLGTGLTEAQRYFVTTAQRSAIHLLGKINDILDFSNIEAGRLQLTSEEFSLRQAVDEVVELLAEPAESKGIELASLVQASTPDRVIGDPARLRQVLRNLADNAVKFTASGEVVVKVAAVRENAQVVTVRFQVADTGIVIPPASRDRLFQPFSQVDGSITRQHGGTGLGLAISRQLVERMGGQIGLQSEPGKGSLFWFTLRLGLARPSDPKPRFGTGSLAGVRALVADDAASTRTILCEQLNAMGARATGAEDGAEALEFLRAAAAAGNPFSLAILDHDMPGPAGPELVRVILSDASLAGIRLIVLVPCRERGLAGGQPHEGVLCRLSKPIREAELVRILAGFQGAAGIDSQAPLGVSLDRLQQSVAAQPKGRILVAEDNAVNQVVARRLMEKMGFGVHVVSNGEEAVEALLHDSYNLVFMDCQMPVLDGYAATARIRGLEGAGRHTPIIAMTAHAMRGDREKCLAAGMDDYLSKPVSVEGLSAVISRWVRSAAPSSLEAAPVDPVR